MHSFSRLPAFSDRAQLWPSVVVCVVAQAASATMVLNITGAALNASLEQTNRFLDKNCNKD